MMPEVLYDRYKKATVIIILLLVTTNQPTK
jgi:hypothetical protein